ncbi:MAG: polyphosphate kinase 1 [Bacteroidales bacterium]|nr:polyphosphate kinase 1 [Bacteroidales bacterium]
MNLPLNNNYIPKEISWLSFNERVLQEADNNTNPLIERIKFLGIYSNNLDEFFRVRVATLKRLEGFEDKGEELLGYSPTETLTEINRIVLRQRSYYESIYQRLLTDMEAESIFFRNEKQLTEEQEKFVCRYFHDNLRPILMPFFIRKETRISSLKDDAIYFAITIVPIKESKKNRYALMQIPSDRLPRFIKLPSEENSIEYIFLDDVIRSGLKELFFIMNVKEITAHTVKVTKDAELDIVDDISESYLEKVSRSLDQRKKGTPVRFLYDRSIPVELLTILTEKLKFVKQDGMIPGGRYHNLKDFIRFPDPGVKRFRFKPLPPLQHHDIERGSSILSKIRKKDILLFFPYHSFDVFIDLLREASLDPSVTDIHITLYRVGRDSSVVHALTNAVKNGKRVTAAIELQARFDEQANIHWSNKLHEEGVKVIYGVPGLKVHAKLCLITRVKEDKVQRYACVGTGNFNEDTSRIYSDHLLLTADTKITNEVAKSFSFLAKNYKRPAFYHLIISPYYTRNAIYRLINNEIKNAGEGKKAAISIKLNNLVDPGVIERLYAASRAGVEVRLMVRAMFSVVTGIGAISDNIRATGIVDRFLEHSRILIFHNGGNSRVYITSGDFMTRNLERRVEVACPVFDPDLKQELTDIFNIQWSDNVKARVLDPQLKNNYSEGYSELQGFTEPKGDRVTGSISKQETTSEPEGKFEIRGITETGEIVETEGNKELPKNGEVRSQYAIYEYLKKKTL